MRAVSYLVSTGHKERDCIYVYGLEKMLEYYRIGIENERRKISEIAIALRISANAKSREFDKYMKSLLPQEDIAIADSPQKIGGLMNLMSRKK
jgi:hypothetical protein